jgi:hypothetical protein
LQNSNTTGGYAEGFAQVQEYFHSMSHPEFAGSLGAFYFNCADASDSTCGDGTFCAVSAISTGANSYKNGFLIAQNLSTFQNRDDTILSGVNTLGSNVFFEADIGSTAPATNYTLDFYALYDHILVLENGLLSVKF